MYDTKNKIKIRNNSLYEVIHELYNEKFNTSNLKIKNQVRKNGVYNNIDLGHSVPYEVYIPKGEKKIPPTFMNIYSIDTGEHTDKRFSYSPLFKNVYSSRMIKDGPKANVWIMLTGNRKDVDGKLGDFSLADKIAQEKNIFKERPGKHTWHHVFMGWLEYPKSSINAFFSGLMGCDTNRILTSISPFKKNYDEKIITYCAENWKSNYNPLSDFSLMQLVYTDTHRKTCPHFGSCKQYVKYIEDLGNTYNGDYKDEPTYETEDEEDED